VIRLFPNTENLGPARFENLRARGAFLVSAAWDGREVQSVRIQSEMGAKARVVMPWSSAVVTTGGESVKSERADGVVMFATQPGAVYEIAR
jgi:hypothetical protein